MPVAGLWMAFRTFGWIDPALSQAYRCQAIQMYRLWAQFCTFRSFGIAYETTFAEKQMSMCAMSTMRDRNDRAELFHSLAPNTKAPTLLNIPRTCFHSRHIFEQEKLHDTMRPYGNDRSLMMFVWHHRHHDCIIETAIEWNSAAYIGDRKKSIKKLFYCNKFDYSRSFLPLFISIFGVLCWFFL